MEPTAKVPSVANRVADCSLACGPPRMTPSTHPRQYEPFPTSLWGFGVTVPHINPLPTLFAVRIIGIYPPGSRPAHHSNGPVDRPRRFRTLQWGLRKVFFSGGPCVRGHPAICGPLVPLRSHAPKNLFNLSQHRKNYFWGYLRRRRDFFWYFAPQARFFGYLRRRRDFFSISRRRRDFFFYFAPQ